MSLAMQHVWKKPIFLVETWCEKPCFSSCKWELKEAAVPVTNVAVHSLFKWMLPGIFYEMDFFCICRHQCVFHFFFFKWNFKAKFINTIASLSWQGYLFDKVSCERSRLFCLAQEPLMECHWWYIRHRMKSAYVCVCGFCLHHVVCTLY